MGATTFTMTAKGTDVNKVFADLHDEAIMEYGHDPYNGTISTTSLGREIRVTDELTKALKSGDWDILEKYDNLLFPEKRQTQYTEQINHYNSFAPKWESDKEVVARKKGVRTLPRYVLVSLNSNSGYGRSYDARNSYDTLTEAKREAKAVSLKNGTDVEVKQSRSNGETIKLGTMKLETDGKEYKSKRTAKTKIYLPIYKFEFFVYAAT